MITVKNPQYVTVYTWKSRIQSCIYAVPQFHLSHWWRYHERNDIWGQLSRYTLGTFYAAKHFRCWSWNSNTLATSCEELTHWKRPWCSEGLGPGGEGDDRGWDGWMALPTWWAWVWVDSGSWWWTGRPGVLRFTGSQRVGHDWATELNWSTSIFFSYLIRIIF